MIGNAEQGVGQKRAVFAPHPPEFLHKVTYCFKEQTERLKVLSVE